MDQLDTFLQELKALSARHGLGIGPGGVLFEMQGGSDGDFDRTYSLSDEGELCFE